MDGPELKHAREVHRTRHTPTSPELKEWWTSGERVGVQTTRTTLRILAAVSALGGFLTGVAALPFSMSMGPGPARLSVAVALCALASVLALAGSWRYGAVKADFLRRYQRQKIYNAIDAITTDHELQAIIRLNQARMDAYHELTLTQAAHAYRNTQFAMGVGFLVLASGAAATLTVASGATSQVVVGALAAVGTSLSGYIVATFLRAQREALGQLNVYFKQPLTNSYLLTAERWALKLPVETRPGTLARMADQVVAQAFGSPATSDSGHREGYDHGPDLGQGPRESRPSTPSPVATTAPLPAMNPELAAMATLLGHPTSNGGSYQA